MGWSLGCYVGKKFFWIEKSHSHSTQFPVKLSVACRPARDLCLRLQSLLWMGSVIGKGGDGKFFVKLRLSAKEHKSASYEIDLLLKSIKGNFYTKNNL